MIEPCEPGEGEPCFTVDGCEGVKLCRENGNGFGECVCEDEGTGGDGNSGASGGEEPGGANGETAGDGGGGTSAGATGGSEATGGGDAGGDTGGGVGTGGTSPTTGGMIGTGGTSPTTGGMTGSGGAGAGSSVGGSGGAPNCAGPVNACGGCSVLAETRGKLCLVTGATSGIWECDGPDALVCTFATPGHYEGLVCGGSECPADFCNPQITPQGPNTWYIYGQVLYCNDEAACACICLASVSCTDSDSYVSFCGQSSC